jgi:hypothetical protein
MPSQDIALNVSPVECCAEAAVRRVPPSLRCLLQGLKVTG